MLGAIIGDTVGLPYEFHNRKTKAFPLFQEACRFTDDGVMTIAVDAVLLACDVDYLNLSHVATAKQTSVSPTCHFLKKRVP